MKKISSKEVCPCCSQLKFKFCCEPFLKNDERPSSPEQLMRSRYSAYYLSDFDYIKKTMRHKALENFNLKESLSHAKKCKWISLKIINSSTEENNKLGFVEFIAEYSLYGIINIMHEKSEFHFHENKWYYVNGVFL